MNRTTVMIDCDEAGHAAPPMGPAAKAARTSISRATRASTSGAGALDVPKRSTAASSRRGMSVKARSPARKRSHGDVVGGDQRGRGPRSGDAGLAGDAQGREARLVRGAEVQAARADQVGWGGGRWLAVWVGHGVLDGKPHIGGAQLGLERAIHEAHGRVDHALGMDDDLDGVVVDIVQPVRLDDLQALVGEGRGIDGDLGSHGPGRMLERPLRGHGRQLGGRGIQERAARGGQDERGDARHGFAHQTLPDGRMFRIDRAQPGQRAGERVTGAGRGALGGQATGLGHDQVTAGDQGLLVGRGHDLAGAQRGQDRPQADHAAGGDDHQVHVVPGGQLDQALRPRRPGR